LLERAVYLPEITLIAGELEGGGRMTNSNKIAIIIASVGRPVELGRWIDHIARQTLKPLEMIWCVTATTDVPPGAMDRQDATLRIILAPKGSCAQRNAGIDAVGADAGIIAFFDDDYVPTSDCLAGMAAAFEAMPDVVGLSGHLIADGINSPGIELDAARAMIDTYEQTASGACVTTLRRAEGLYGCNMAYRRTAVGAHRFDERLPLYGWQEDWDFASRVAGGRAIGMTPAFAGVHQGVKGGRTSGRKFGYSQIINPVYLTSKGSMSLRKAATLMSKNFVANHVKLFNPEPWVDRRGRVAGNWLAIRDLVFGRIQPEHAAVL